MAKPTKTLHQTSTEVLKEADRDFVFKARRQKLDWKKLSLLNVDAIILKNDLSSITAFTENLAFCNVDNEGKLRVKLDSLSICPNMSKLFQLSQLTIEHLIHSRVLISIMIE